MNCNPRCFFQIFFLIAFVFVGSLYAQEGHFTVGGKVIDENGKRVVNAMVLLNTSYDREIYEAVQTGDDGQFKHIQNRFKTDLWVVVEEEPPKDFWNVLAPTFFTVKRLPGFEGVKIEVPRVGNVDVGKIHPTISYSKLKIDFAKLFGLTDEVVIKNLDTARISVSLGKHKTLDKDEIPERAFTGVVGNFAIPKADWQVVISISDGRKKHEAKLYLEKGSISTSRME